MKELEKFVIELNEKIKEKKGEIIFCLREFSLPCEVTGDFLPPVTGSLFYYGAGIINGELKKLNTSLIETITLSQISLEQLPLNKILYGEYSIPINRKFKGFSRSFSYDDYFMSFRFGIQDLENQLEPGQLAMDSGEMISASQKAQGIFNSRFRDSDLRDFYLLIGDKEVEDFMKEKKLDKYQELFKVLKDPNYAENIIFKDYNEKRERIAKELIISANKIANNFREVQSLEKSIMNAHLITDWDEDGRKIKKWNVEDVNIYYSSKKEILNQRNELNKYFLEEKKIRKPGKMPVINGKIIGFPRKISFIEYSHWLKNELIPKINETFNRIDNYLNKEKGKSKVIEAKNYL